MKDYSGIESITSSRFEIGIIYVEWRFTSTTPSLLPQNRTEVDEKLYKNKRSKSCNTQDEKENIFIEVIPLLSEQSFT